MSRESHLRRVLDGGLVAIVRCPDSHKLVEVCRALADGGVTTVEITMTVPDALEVIEELATDASFSARGAIVGAGTVLNGRQADAALLAGARFLVSAIFVPDMVATARAHDAMSMPGTMTPTEMVQAADCGADFIKVFPVAAIGGPDYIRNVRRALIHLPLVATGNIDLEDIPEYFAAGVVGFGIGAPLIRTDLIERGNVAGVIANAERFLAATRRPATN